MRYFFFFLKCKTNLIKMVKSMKMKTGGGCAVKKTMKGGAKKPMKGGAKKPMKGGDSGAEVAAPPAAMPAVPKPTMAAQAGGSSKKSKKSAGGPVMGWCMKCKMMHEMKDPVEYVAKNGRKMAKGKCATNGNGMSAIVGN